eukprot:CAMPEP_0179009442 /NCGR_PEP_ID=MMETSP0795-20121207/16276_1 /TAXON_ID=88552 /ORGANISM="Amoebophrya sp., Strain Ameob2" /LENGTH=278 /DNA_ID=CAMNT_0020704643 /DNA_START=209 /DNA_END=1042 /DNA_ORIENTATION=+
MEGADATPSFCLKSVVADYQPRTPPRLYKQDTTILKLSDHSVLNFGVTQSWSPHHHSSPAGRWQTPVVEVATTEKISELGAYGGIPQCGTTPPSSDCSASTNTASPNVFKPSSGAVTSAPGVPRRMTTTTTTQLGPVDRIPGHGLLDQHQGSLTSCTTTSTTTTVHQHSTDRRSPPPIFTTVKTTRKSSTAGLGPIRKLCGHHSLLSTSGSSESSGQSTEEYYPSDFESETDGETERRQRDLLTAQRSLLKEKCAEVEKDEAEYVITKEGQEKTDGEW